MKKLLCLIMVISAPAYAEKGIDCSKATATLELLHCGSEEYKVLENERETLEDKIIQKARKMDEVHIENGREEYAENEKGAQMSEKAFEEYRGRECSRQEIWAG